MGSSLTVEHQQEVTKFDEEVSLLLAKKFGPLDSDNCGARIEALTAILTDWHAVFPRAQFDQRAWEHLLVYAPIEVLRKTVALKETNGTG